MSGGIARALVVSALLLRAVEVAAEDADPASAETAPSGPPVGYMLHGVEVSLAADGAASFGRADGNLSVVGGRVSVRAGGSTVQLQSVVSFDPLGAHRAARVDSDFLVLAGVGPTIARRDWLLHAAAGLGTRSYAFEDVWGTGRVSGILGVAWVRAGVTRRFPIFGRVDVRVGLDGTLAWSPRDEDRFRRAEIGGGIALVSLTAGLELGGRFR